MNPVLTAVAVPRTKAEQAEIALLREQITSWKSRVEEAEKSAPKDPWFGIAIPFLIGITFAWFISLWWLLLCLLVIFWFPGIVDSEAAAVERQNYEKFLAELRADPGKEKPSIGLEPMTPSLPSTPEGVIQGV